VDPDAHAQWCPGLGSPCPDDALAPGGARSEAALVVKGDRDDYTLQWAERSAPISSPIILDVAKWSERLQRLMS